MFRDHIFFKEIKADGTPAASFEGSIILDDEEFTIIRNNLILRGIIGQSASNKNGDGEEYGRIRVCDIRGTREEKKRFGRKITVLEMADGTEYFITFWHGYNAIPVLEEILEKRGPWQEPVSADELTEEERALLEKLAKRGDVQEMIDEIRK